MGSVLVEDLVWDLCTQERPHPSAVCHAFLVLFSLVQAVLRAGSARHISGMVGSSPALLCLSGSWGHLLLAGVGVLGAAPNVGLWLWHSQDCCSLWDRASLLPELGEGNFHISMEVGTGMNLRGYTSHEGWEAGVELPRSFSWCSSSHCSAGRGCLCKEH